MLLILNLKIDTHLNTNETKMQIFSIVLENIKKKLLIAI